MNEQVDDIASCAARRRSAPPALARQIQGADSHANMICDRLSAIQTHYWELKDQFPQEDEESKEE
eukprot:8718899-Pyramimonas_sp.AAC.1